MYRWRARETVPAGFFKTRCMMMRMICMFAILGGICITGCASKPQAAAPRKQTYAFWPAAPDAPHIQFVTAINSSKDIAEQRKGGFDAMIYGADPEQVLAVQKPYGVRF